MNQVCIFLFIQFISEYILRKVRLERDKCCFKIGGKTSNLSYADDTTMTVENDLETGSENQRVQ